MTNALSPDVRRELGLIEPSVTRRGILVYPCSALLRDGKAIECIYFVDAASYKRLFGQDSPEDDPGKRWIAPNHVASIRESPRRLPSRFTAEIYRLGETGFNTIDFTLVFSWWYRRDYTVPGSFVDFLEYPLWLGPADVKAVVPYPRRKKLRRMPDIYWCVFTDHAIEKPPSTAD